MKLKNKKTGEVVEDGYVRETYDFQFDGQKHVLAVFKGNGHRPPERISGAYTSLAELNEEWEDYKPAEPLIKDEKIRKAVRAWAEAENCTREMNLYYTLNRQEKYIIFHNPQTGSELQLCEFDYPDFKELCEYTIAELCGEEEG